jgi:16S rRNA C967 or C1407 C5-methylase (RsmB/RsmF family)
VIAFWVFLALIVLLGGSMVYIVCTINAEEKAAALRRREQSFEEVPMS